MRNYVYILLFLLPIKALATHNRAGEITFRHISGSTYEITLTTYVKESSPAERPNLEIFWGDGTSLDSIARTSQIPLGNDIEKNVYIDQHTYPGPSPTPYVIKIEDPNRNSGIINIPNSVNIVFYIETELLINPFLGINNSPVLLNPPIDNACVGIPYIHNPGAVDTDGDSLSYSLQLSRGQSGEIIPNYQFPLASSSLTIDNVTGDLIWDAPVQQGEHNISILIEEFRNGQKIGSVLRDMQITVFPICDPPPVITGPVDTCVIAGDTLNFDIQAMGSSPITLSATGIPFTISNPAIFQQTTNPAISTSGNFSWITECDHIREQAYAVSFKAVDQGIIQLVDFLTTTITVIGPPPQNLTTNVQSNTIGLSWSPTECDQVIGYKVYRRRGPSGWIPERCQTGIPDSLGFQLITQTTSLIDTSFVDNNNGLGLTSGEEYCYRVVACYPDGAQSKASDEVCAQLKRDVPIITNVSVNTTSETAGSIFVAWARPTEHDTIQFPGPYCYLIYRGEESTSNLVLIDSTASINDITYVDTLLNTQDFQYAYRVDIFNLTAGTRELISSSAVASSIYLNLTPSDNQITLTWDEMVPWTNNEYIIFRQSDSTLLFDSLTSTTSPVYIDTNLPNGVTYCYKIRTIGAYSITDIVNPILNYSQEICAEAIDNVIPCPPTLFVEPDCDLFQNFLHWENQASGCADDILEYKIYRKNFLEDEDYFLVTVIPNGLSGPDTTFLHDGLSSISGCYAITSIDSVGNESVFSDSVCVENCPEYQLPNVFTPGADGINDVFTPFPFRFVESIQIQIFNRWGLLIFETTNPEILWDGINQQTSKECNDGTYFYVCTVNEIFLEGIRPRVLRGFITLLRNKGSSGP